MPVQLPLIVTQNDQANLTQEVFSHGNTCTQQARIALEKKYSSLLKETDKFSRKLVSYQGNKGEVIHGWIQYKEGFSSRLVEILISRFGIHPGDTILDPFSGSATTLLVAKFLGINAFGIEILPLCHLAWEAKSYVLDYDLGELRQVYEQLTKSIPGKASEKFPHITITETAFPSETENDIMFYTEWFENLNISDPAKVLCKLVLTSILGEVSYTRKDGQYLRWDYRSGKMRNRNETKTSPGKGPAKKVDKGILPSVKEAILRSFKVMLSDIEKLQQLPFKKSHQKLIRGNTLMVLPTLEADQFAGVITSPPYCNRYDYTRIYALEIAYLQRGCDIRELRQDQLSCTVESRSKLSVLQKYYQSLGQQDKYNETLSIIQNNSAFIEINEALQLRWQRGDMNNKGVLTMVEQYFTELTFVFAELFRVCRSGAHVAFVNDNVRYGGEVIPVDLLSTSLAESLGFEPVRVYVLPQRKGNSSQQMEKFGREALRKSITVWKKP